MSESIFHKELFVKLDKIEKTMDYIKEHISDSYLSTKEKKLMKRSYDNESKNKLITSKLLRKKLGI